MKYKLRFSSKEEQIFMLDIFRKYVEYVNNKSSMKLYFTKDPFYEESMERYYINMEVENVKLGNNPQPEPRMGVNYHIYKKELNEWMKENNIIKPKFPIAELIR